jgi:hemolysin activation/secretion protein
MSRSLLIAVPALAALILSPTAHAQVDPAIQMRQQQRRSQREAATQPPTGKLRSPASTPALDSNPADVPETTVWLASPAISIRRNRLIDPSEIDRVLAPYHGLPLGPTRIGLLLRQLDALLVRNGLVTSRARVVRLDRVGGKLSIDLVTGTIGTMKENGKPFAAGVRNAFPSGQGDALLLQDLEQGVHQIQRLRMYQAEMNILPGQAPATSEIDLMLKRSKPWWLQFALDNQGAEATGKNRRRATLTLEDTLGLLDGIAVTYIESARSQAALAAISLPQGYNTWSLSYAASRYHEPLPFGLMEKGGSKSGSLAWNRVLYLAADGRDSTDLALTYSDAERRISGYTLTPTQLTVLRGTLDRMRQGLGWRAWGEAGAVAGMPWFGAIHDSDGLRTADAHAEFVKFELHAGVAVAIADTGLQYVGQFDAQHSRVGLYDQEQFSLGGMNTVRGYAQGIAVGDSGYLFRHELQTAPHRVDAWNADLTPFAFVDHGEAWSVIGTAYHLAAAGIGLRFVQKHGGADLAVAKPISHSSSLSPHDWTLHFALRIDL